MRIADPGPAAPDPGRGAPSGPDAVDPLTAGLGELRRRYAEALGAEGKALAFCRSGTRSTYLWALSQAAGGQDVEDITRKAAVAGYDLTPIRPFLG